MMNSASGCLLISPASLKESPDDLVALVVMAQDDQAAPQLLAGLGDPPVHLLVRQAQVLLRERLSLPHVLLLVGGKDRDEFGHLVI